MHADRPPDLVPPFDPGRFRTRPIAGRQHRVTPGDFASVVDPDARVADYLASLPDLLGAKALRGLASAVATARRHGRPVLWGLGGHVVKVGLGPLLVDLAERGFVQGLVMNGAAAIHDAEVAMVGSTSEDVARGLFEGDYGTAEETAALFATAARRSVVEELGYGTALARSLVESEPPHASLSLLCQSERLGVPVTVHVAVGTDTVHMAPVCRGDDVGAATHRDFLRLATLVDGLDGGVYVNVGSAVVLPEVFLKAVALVHNVRSREVPPLPHLEITTGNMDMIRHYRPLVNVLERPAVAGYQIVGHHELNLPLLRMAVLVAATGADGEGADA